MHVSGPVDAPAIVLFHAYQATSAEWVELAHLLGGRAADLPRRRHGRCRVQRSG
ncbi:MAG TPA: hypothetical protein VES60_07295 [Nakamurella sp.]|nr:hypothetical protein [Nakamurella sp.]